MMFWFSVFCLNVFHQLSRLEVNRAVFPNNSENISIFELDSPHIGPERCRTYVGHDKVTQQNVIAYSSWMEAVFTVILYSLGT